MKRTLYLCGAGNSEGVRLARRINDAELRWERIVLLDDDPAKKGRCMVGVEVAGPFELLGQADPTRDEVQNLVARTTEGRSAARRKIASFGIPFATLISPNVDTEGVTYDSDVIVYHNATLGPEVTLGESCVVFMGAVVGHECHVGNGCIMASNSVLNARVVLQDLVYVGTNSTVLPETNVGSGATIGAGSVVVQHVPAKATAFGVPAQIVHVPTGDADLSIGSNGHTFSNNLTIDLPSVSKKVRVLEHAIAEIWKDEIGLDSVSLEESFFDVGGHSLLALRVLDRIKTEVHAHLSLADVFRYPTVRSLANHLASSEGEGGLREGEQRAACRRRVAARHG